MLIVDFTKELLPQAHRLTMENYLEERAAVPVLPEIPSFPPLDFFAENGLGVAAVEDGRLLGFLGGYPPFKPVYCTPDTAGVWSPLHAHAVQKENRLKLWQRLYQAAGEKWAKAGAASHSITLYTHDTDAQKALYLYGFGARCADFMRPPMPLQSALRPEITCMEVHAANSTILHPLRAGLMEHLALPPCFMRLTAEDISATLKERETQSPRMFVAFDKHTPIAYIELKDEGENFISCMPDTANICGAFCLPEYRGTGAAQALLDFMIRLVRKEGYIRLGVDCETINPTAIGFWSKYFAQYTTSVVRRIDENAILW